MIKNKLLSKCLLLMIGITASSCSAQSPVLGIEGNSELVSDEFNLMVTGLKPNQEITLHTKTFDQRD